MIRLAEDELRARADVLCKMRRGIVAIWQQCDMNASVPNPGQ
jgi:hypothetical protein